MSLFSAQTAFYCLAVVSIASAILAVTRKNPVHSMLWVLVLFLQVAGIFLLLRAEFLAAVQVIVYAGAILVFYLFVLMLLDLPGELVRPRYGAHWPFAVVGGLLFAALTWMARATTFRWVPAEVTQSELSRTADVPFEGSLAEVGAALFGPFALPFEIASLVLLAAIVGAVVLARRRTAES